MTESKKKGNQKKNEKVKKKKNQAEIKRYRIQIALNQSALKAMNVYFNIYVNFYIQLRTPDYAHDHYKFLQGFNFIPVYTQHKRNGKNIIIKIRVNRYCTKPLQNIRLLLLPHL